MGILPRRRITVQLLLPQNQRAVWLRTGTMCLGLRCLRGLPGPALPHRQRRRHRALLTVRRRQQPRVGHSHLLQAGLGPEEVQAGSVLHRRPVE